MAQRSAALRTAIADEWRELAARALEPNVFYEPAFALAAAPVFGADAGAVLVRSAAGRLVGLFPGAHRAPPRRDASMLTGWTHPYAPLGVPLVDRDEPEAAIAALLDHLEPRSGDAGAAAAAARCPSRARSRRR